MDLALFYGDTAILFLALPLNLAELRAYDRTYYQLEDSKLLVL